MIMSARGGAGRGGSVAGGGSVARGGSVVGSLHHFFNGEVMEGVGEVRPAPAPSPSPGQVPRAGGVGVFLGVGLWLGVGDRPAGWLAGWLAGRLAGWQARRTVGRVGFLCRWASLPAAGASVL